MCVLKILSILKKKKKKKISVVLILLGEVNRFIYISVLRYSNKQEFFWQENKQELILKIMECFKFWSTLTLKFSSPLFLLFLFSFLFSGTIHKHYSCYCSLFTYIFFNLFMFLSSLFNPKSNHFSWTFPTLFYINSVLELKSNHKLLLLFRG